MDWMAGMLIVILSVLAIWGIRNTLKENKRDKKNKEDQRKCIYLEKMEYGLYCTRGFPTVYVRTGSSFVPICKGCKRKTVLIK